MKNKPFFKLNKIKIVFYCGFNRKRVNCLNDAFVNCFFCEFWFIYKKKHFVRITNNLVYMYFEKIVLSRLFLI